jgi:DNA-directed RNA polymerase subunit RPC12/RpoP
MPHYTEYRCSRCGLPTERDLLIVKAIVFKTMGAGPKIIKSRNKDWLCDECIVDDPDFNSESFANAPGMRSAAKDRVEAERKKELLK